MEISLESCIRQYCNIKGSANSKGWHTCKCKVCNDYKVRAAFNFSGYATTYHCFNCAFVAKHDPSEYASISENMQTVLDAFNVPSDVYKQITLNILEFNLNNGTVKKTKTSIDPDTELVECELLSCFKPLQKATDTWSTIAKEYLQYDRNIDPESYPFYIMKEKKYDKELENKWRGRLIIPYYRENKVIWYQGRDLRPTSKLRYLNAESESECILSNFDSINQHVNTPIMVCEGFFDAHCIDGVAIFGNVLKKGQLKVLNRTNRQKIYIPDRVGKGYLAANQAIDNGWSVSIPDIGSCKDINQAIVKYGKLYVMKSIRDSILTGDGARIAVSMLCK